MKKRIVGFLLICSLLVVPTFAQTMQDNATYLVDLLGQGKQQLSVQTQYDFRTHREQLLDVAKDTSNKKELIIAVQDSIKTKLQLLASQADRPKTKEGFGVLINQMRIIYKLGPLHYVDALDTLAQSYADQIQASDHFDHVSVNGDSIEQRIAKVDYDYHFVGENLAKGYDTMTGVLKGWIQSPTHKANLLFPQYTDMGLGRAGNYRVHIFGSTQ